MRPAAVRTGESHPRYVVQKVTWHERQLADHGHPVVRTVHDRCPGAHDVEARRVRHDLDGNLQIACQRLCAHLRASALVDQRWPAAADEDAALLRLFHREAIANTVDEVLQERRRRLRHAQLHRERLDVDRCADHAGQATRVDASGVDDAARGVSFVRGPDFESIRAAFDGDDLLAGADARAVRRRRGGKSRCRCEWIGLSLDRAQRSSHHAV
jgi:hypothetical protein